MKKYILLLILGSLASLSFSAPKAKYNENPHFKDVPWSEDVLPLPPYPDMNEEEWQSFFVGINYKNITSLHVKSLNINTEDLTLRYVLNIKTPTGVDNISAEAFRCANRQNKIFAFADTKNKKWIKNQMSDWTSVNQNDSVRNEIYYMFCRDGVPKTRDEVINRFMSGSERGTIRKREGGQSIKP